MPVSETRTGSESLFTRWPEPIRTEVPDSYFGWLNAPCASDPLRDQVGVLVSNLAFGIHRARPDLQAAYPELFGSHRLSFVNWFLIYAMAEYALDLAFLAPVFESIARVDALDQP